MKLCFVCNSNLNEPIYKSPTKLSVTSLCEFVPLETKVYACTKCTHLQTDPIDNIESYYSNDYKILIDSEEEDQLYKFEGTERIYRFDHQVDTLLKKITIPEGALLLDYGCAKASTIKKLMNRRPDIVPHLFDVSDMYKSFWKKFVDDKNVATFSVRPAWMGAFDVVTSFFAMEHIPKLKEVITEIHSLLKEGGTFYCIVPNVFTNPADFIVLDHVNHFSPLSLKHLLEKHGFSDVSLDENSHESAIVVTASKTMKKKEPSSISEDVKATYLGKANDMASYWSNLGTKIKSFSETLKGTKVSIYGSGFYGSFIVSCLNDPESINSFIDQSPFRIGKFFFGKQVLHPSSLPQSVSHILVGINPRVAKREIEKVVEWSNRKLTYFYL